MTTDRRKHRSIWAALTGLALAACETAVIAEDDDFLVVRPAPGTTVENLAAEFLGDPRKAWQITELNGDIDGGAVVIPRKPVRPAGVRPNGYQLVPVLTYHNFSVGGACKGMVVCMDAFKAQMQVLRDEGYEVVSVDDLDAFLAGEAALPPKAVMVTIDDGWRAAYDLALPVLAEYGYEATLFLYTDFPNASAAMSWDDVRAAKSSPWLRIESHTQTHPNLAELPQLDIANEMVGSRAALKRKIKVDPVAVAYPYGAADSRVVKAAIDADYELGFTVKRGGNPAFADPMLLKRTMIYGEDDLQTFRARLETFEEVRLQ